MKKTLIYMLLIVVFTIILGSCKNWIDPAINKDPNNPDDVSVKNLLAPIQATIGYGMGSDICRFASMFTQHHQGIDRQHLQIYQYNFVESDVTNSWDNITSVSMSNLYQLIQKSTDNQSYHYRGVARVLMAFCLGVITDVWGDVPYTQAFQGYAHLKPKYDLQQDIYTTILPNLLDSAIADLNASKSTFDPAGDDLIYGGDLSKWIKAAFSLKARFYIHTTKRDPNAAAKALDALSKGALSSIDDDCVVKFGTAYTNSNPWFQFINERGDIDIATYFLDDLQGLKDPREIPFTQNGEAGALGSYYASSTSPVPLITFSEVKFIEAEAKLAANDQNGAKTAMITAITASLKTVGTNDTDIAAYIAQTAVVPTGNIALSDIMAQKYIAMYTQLEPWTDWRRTGLPDIPATDGKTKADIPRRFPYSQSERLYNADNFPGTKPNTDRVWWDK